ncbi:MAG: CAF17-like 4Fe-4S cluster assembly/insertion protein YgfZ [Caldimonas sp.]
MQSPRSLDGACRIAELGVIRVRGADAGKFLQGQLTNDVLGLGPANARLAGFCSAKGRLQASFVVWQSGVDEYLLACSASLLAPTLKRLSMFVLRAQCKLSDASAEIALWGLVGPTAEAWLGDAAPWERRDQSGATLIRLPDGAATRRALLALPSGVEPSLPLEATLDPQAWRWLEVQSGVVTIEAATVDRFVPQMVNFELVGGVDFHKGCYPGQEVVARSQYRGTTKRRTMLFEVAGAASAGQDVFAPGAGAEPAGTVANASARPDAAGSSALVEVRLGSLGQGELRLGSIDGPVLRRAELPYPLALDSEAAA